MARSRQGQRSLRDERETLLANAKRMGDPRVTFGRKTGVVSVVFPSGADTTEFNAYMNRVYPSHTKGELLSRGQPEGYGFFFHLHGRP